jgi:hypothetical protein
MGTFNKSGQASITNGKLGTTTNYSLGSTGTTKYSLNKGGALVTTQWLIAGVPWSKTLIPGDTIEHSWQLGSTGTTEYNMGRNGSKTLKYTLDPGGNIEESNGRITGKTGTASYTLGTGSRSDVTATLGKGSTQTYTVGPGGSSTISITEAGVPTTITLGPGDSSTTTITEGATAVLESESVYDPDNPKVESMDYDVGEDGSTDNTWGGDTWDVWLFQPYFINGFPDESTDFDPICVVMPRGEYNPGCPGRLPSFIQDNGDYPAGTNCRYILVGSAYKGADGWKITQNCIGTLTFATENSKQDENPQVAPEEIVNHYQVEVFGAPDNWQLRVGRGGNIWRPVLGDCDKQLRTDIITPASFVGINPGSITTSPWASDDGYVNIYEESNYYVYAYKVETLEDAYFYIYVTTDGNLDSSCPVTLPEEIETPTVEHTVQVLRVAEIDWDGVNWNVNQRVLGSITWPNQQVEGIEEFKVNINRDGLFTKVKVARGRVLARCADLTTQTQSFPAPSFNYVAYKPQCLKEFNVKNFAVYQDGALYPGTSTSSPWASDNGYVLLPLTSGNSFGVYLVMNQFDASGYISGAPYLAVIADTDENEALEKSRPYGDGSCDSVEYYSNQVLEEQPALGPYYLYVKTDVTPSYSFESGVKNYNCQRVKIASITNLGGDVFSVTQHLIGTLTIPSQFNHKGLVSGIVPNHTTGLNDWMTNPFAAWPLYSSQNTAWNGTWSGYTKAFTGATVEIPL